MERRVPASMLKKKTEKMKQMPKVKITGTAATTPRVSSSMSKSQPSTVSRAPGRKISSGTKVNMPKTTGAKPSVKKLMPLTGPAAIEAIQRRTSPSGVKKAEAGAKKAIDKKYPGLYKKNK
jgi:hypothetical protein